MVLLLSKSVLYQSNKVSRRKGTETQSIGVLSSLHPCISARPHNRDCSRVETNRSVRLFFSFTSLHYDIHLRECRNGEAYKKRSGKRGGGVVCALAKPGKNGQHKTVNVM